MNNLHYKFLSHIKICAKLPYHSLRHYATTKSSRVLKASQMFKESLRRMRREQRENTPCYLRVRRSEYKCLAYQEMEDDPCRPKQCLPPLDLKGYEPSDKEARKYQKTWCDFKPVPRRKPKMRKIYPQRKRRNTAAFRDRQCTACEPEDCELPVSDRAPPPKLSEPKTTPWPCCKMYSVTCRSKRKTVKCDAGRMPSCCVKKQTPYQSFSECKKYRLLPPIAACECDQKPSVCEMWRFWRTKR